MQAMLIPDNRGPGKNKLRVQFLKVLVNRLIFNMRVKTVYRINSVQNIIIYHNYLQINCTEIKL